MLTLLSRTVTRARNVCLCLLVLSLSLFLLLSHALSVYLSMPSCSVPLSFSLALSCSLCLSRYLSRALSLSLSVLALSLSLSLSLLSLSLCQSGSLCCETAALIFSTHITAASQVQPLEPLPCTARGPEKLEVMILCVCVCALKFPPADFMREGIWRQERQEAPASQVFLVVCNWSDEKFVFVLKRNPHGKPDQLTCSLPLLTAHQTPSLTS